MDIYVKPRKTIKADNQRIIKLKDVAEIYSSGGNPDKYNEIILLNISADKRKNYLISILDIVKAVMAIESKATVVNIGEINVVVQFSPNPKKDNKAMNFIKTVIVSVILFFGASTAIMTFHADSEVPKLLEGYYEMFYQDDSMPYVLEIPYSIGLALGIIIFFNHFSKAQMSLDPTPIEVQMTTYEKEVLDNQIDLLDMKKGD